MPAAANLISGNTNGIEISDSRSNLVQGNLIGTDTTGTFAVGNSGAGVLVDNGSSANTIGGAVGGALTLSPGNAEGVVDHRLGSGHSRGGQPDRHRHRGHVRSAQLDRRHRASPAGRAPRSAATTALALNVISGNDGDGIDVGGGATSTLIQGNYIGTDQTGTKPLPNTGDGLSVDDAAGVTIGGTSQSAHNVISANTQAGVSISGTAATGVVLWGNRIGTDHTASLPLGNGTFGVVASGTAGVTIGGTATGDGTSSRPTRPPASAFMRARPAR